MFKPPGRRAPLEHGDGETLLGKFCRAGQRRWTRSDADDPLAALPARFRGQPRAPLQEMFHRVSLQASDRDGLLVVAQHHAGAFAEYFHGTDARTTCTQDVGVQNGERRPHQVLCRDFLDEARHVDVRWTRRRAGRVKAIQTAIGLGQRLLRIEGGMQIGKSAGDLRVVLKFERNRARPSSRSTKRMASRSTKESPVRPLADTMSTSTHESGPTTNSRRPEGIARIDRRREWRAASGVDGYVAQGARVVSVQDQKPAGSASLRCRGQ